MGSEVDSFNNSLINLLNSNARLPYTHIAHKLGITAHAAQQTVQQLVNEGAVTLEVIPNFAKLGFRIETFMGLFIHPAKSESAVEQLKVNPSIAYIAFTSGRYDVVLWGVFRSLDHLADFVERDVAIVDGIQGSETMINLRVSKRAWVKYPDSVPVTRQVDTLEKRLIYILRDDVRLSISTLALKLGISLPTIRSRLARLVNEGLIAFSAVPNPSKLGEQNAVHIGLKVRPDSLQEVQKQLKYESSIQYIALTTGRYDIVIWAVFQNNSELIHFRKCVLASVAGIERSETLINHEIVKWTFKDIIASI
ncbi:Lrp/AsnC family transcriptional regulator [Chloroflexota bacterium]